MDCHLVHRGVKNRYVTTRVSPETIGPSETSQSLQTVHGVTLSV